MSIDPEDALVEKIETILAQSGFPDKKVSLPYEKVASAAAADDVDLEMALSRLSMSGVYSAQQGNKLVFANESIESSGMPDLSSFAQGAGDANPSPSIDPNMFGGTGMPDMSQFKGKSPAEQQAMVGDIMNKMSDEQRDGLMNMWSTMPDDEKAKLMEQAKGMGISPF